MLKFFKSPRKEVVPLTKKTFRKLFALELGGYLLLTATLYSLHTYGFLSLNVALVSFLIINFLMCLMIPNILHRRIVDIHQDQKISGFSVAFFTLMPITNLSLLIYGFTKDSGKGHLALIPVLSKKRYALSLYAIFTVQAMVMGIYYSPASFPVLALLSNPSTQKICYTAAQASVIFSAKQKFVGTGRAMLELEKIQDELPFDNTGHILSIAVIASDINRMKQKQGRGPAAIKTAITGLVTGVLHQEGVYRKNRNFFGGYTPLSFLSPANMTELSLLILIDKSIDEKMNVAIKKKLNGFLADIERISKGKETDTDFIKELSELKKKVARL